MNRWVLVALATLAAGCSSPVATIFAPLGKTASQKLELPPGPLCFPTEIQGVTYDQTRKILVTVKVLRKGKVVASVIDCRGYSINHHATSGTRSGHSVQRTTECALTVPTRGADQIMVSTRLDSGTATVQGLRVQVHQGEGLLCGIF
jgi:hypothetical protein